MDIFDIVIILIISIVAMTLAFMLIDRVCKCIEHCATAKAFGRYAESGVMARMEDIDGKIRKTRYREEKSNRES